MRGKLINEKYPFIKTEILENNNGGIFNRTLWEQSSSTQCCHADNLRENHIPLISQIQNGLQDKIFSFTNSGNCC